MKLSSIKAPAALQQRWDRLEPKRKQHVVWGAAGLFLFLLGWQIFSEPGAAPAEREVVRSRIANELMPASTARDLGMSGLATTVSETGQSQRQLEQNVSHLRTELAQQKTRGNAGADRDAAKRNQSELAELRKQIDELRRSGVQPPTVAAAPRPTTTVPGMTNSHQGGAAIPFAPVAAPRGVIRTIGAAPAPSAGAGSPGNNSNAPPQAPLPGARGGKTGAKAVPTQYMPSGSLLTGVNVTGMDAPTGKQAMRDPIPLLVRIKANAILPNRYRADVKECFVVASGHGDLASERAYLRSETISCIRKDKRVIDVKVQMIAIGPDGKAGVRGRLVSKQGQVIAKASLAGLAQGISQAFSGSNFRLDTQSPNADYGQALTSGAGQGVGSAFDRIAKYYLDMADQMFPVVEIDAGQKITFLMVQGTQMGTLH